MTDGELTHSAARELQIMQKICGVAGTCLVHPSIRSTSSALSIALYMIRHRSVMILQLQTELLSNSMCLHKTAAGREIISHLQNIAVVSGIKSRKLEDEIAVPSEKVPVRTVGSRPHNYTARRARLGLPYSRHHVHRAQSSEVMQLGLPYSRHHVHSAQPSEVRVWICVDRSSFHYVLAGCSVCQPKSHEAAFPIAVDHLRREHCNSSDDSTELLKQYLHQVMDAIDAGSTISDAQGDMDLEEFDGLDTIGPAGEHSGPETTERVMDCLVTLQSPVDMGQGRDGIVELDNSLRAFSRCSAAPEEQQHTALALAPLRQYIGYRSNPYMIDTRVKDLTKETDPPAFAMSAHKESDATRIPTAPSPPQGHWAKTIMHNRRSRFFRQLYQVLSDPASQHVLDWSNQGRTFSVFDKIEFEKILSQRFCETINFAEFVRKLNYNAFYQVWHQNKEEKRPLYSKNGPWVFEYTDYQGETEELMRMKKKMEEPLRMKKKMEELLETSGKLEQELSRSERKWDFSISNDLGDTHEGF
ncbi:MAG: kinase-regulated stress-responsive transcription factor skn7 [Chrysothrix sp. TS-e1954]|nr:MAG: kinase-regulated stress-responsive transcription factor skn7 [Chrysothrix sp. TS-e1954]